MHNLRTNGKTYKFTTLSLNSMMYSSYSNILNKSETEMTYKLLCSGGVRIRTKKRNLVMYQWGGTIGPSRFPTFALKHEDEDTRHMLPRPVVKSRPGYLGHKLMTTSIWLQSLCKDIETLTINHFRNQKTQTSEKVLKHIGFCKKNIPNSLRICDTCFTQMIMVGSFNSTEGNIPIHVDNDDFITALLSVEGSSKTNGGTTLYIEKKTNNNKESLIISKRIPFRNGNVQIGCFHNVLHGTTRWSDSMRGVVNFSMQKKLLQHFYKFGTEPYEAYVKARYPRGSFHAIV